MNYVQVNRDSFDLIDHFKTKYPQYSQLLENIESSLNLRLWHQLSDDLVSFSNKHELQNGTDLIELYNRVIISLEKAFNPMKLMLIIVNIVKNFSHNLNEALLFLESFEQRIDSKGEEYIYLLILKGECLLKLGKLYECEDIIKSTKAQLEKRFEVDQIIYSSFYKLSAYYYEKKGNYDDFYNNCLQYLGYMKDSVSLK